jgi:aspartate racemase
MRTIGILGGMGPVATGEFFDRILARCEDLYGAVQDGEYPPILLYSMSLHGSNESGIGNARLLEQEFLDGAAKLVRGGCDFVVIPCNTAHHFVDRLRRDVAVPILSMIDLTVTAVGETGAKTVGVLASESTYQHAIYARPLGQHGITAVLPTPVERKELTAIVREVMGGQRTPRDRETMRRIARRMAQEDRVDTIVIGCTELSVVLPASQYPLRTVDAMDILVEASVSAAYEAVALPTTRISVAVPRRSSHAG